MRKTEFAIGEFYHVYNRGVDKREVFLNDRYYERFLLSMYLLNDERDGLIQNWRDFKLANPKAQLWEFPRLSLGVARKQLVEIVAYCLNPNHYHLILQQLEAKGIEKFMQRLGTAYTMYFNKKNQRSGALFQGRFKAIHIDSNEYLLYLSAYVNMNNFIHGYGNNNTEWKYSSLGHPKVEPWGAICRPDAVRSQFKNVDSYLKFVENNALYLKEKKEEKKYLLED